MIPKAKVLTMLVSLIAMYSGSVAAQAPASTLKVELRDVVEYQLDTNDLSKYRTNPGLTVGSITPAACLGIPAIALGDIVSVNGQPAKGAYVSRAENICVGPTAVAGQPIADTTHNSMRYETYEILQSDGTPVGTVMTEGLNAGGPSPPGPAAGSMNFAIVGGTGAFLGARGQTGNAAQGLGSAAVPIRTASITEDPANRRLNGGGHVVFTLYVIPMEQPQIILTASGPAITHSSDFSLVSASKPAAAGELLSLFATGLGPTVPGTAPGQPFPSSPLSAVNSPVAVTVNGAAAQVISAVGYPGATDGYQLNFQMPPDTSKGTAAIQISAAWIAGPPVSIPVK
jgi:uncharacterized protein (TIGR03437 family)